MKATGIVRRIDDLGRIVLPKEVRRTMKIREGDPLEIFLSDDGVTLKKYTVKENLTEMFENVLETADEMLEGVHYDTPGREELTGTVVELQKLTHRIKMLQRTYDAQ